MNCKNCGNLVSGTEKFCNICGTPIEGVVPQPNQYITNPEVPSPATVPIVENPMGIPVQVPSQVVMPQPTMGGQPTGMNQMPPQQPMNMGGIQPAFPPMQPAPKKNNLVFIIAGIVLITVVAIVALTFILGKDKEKEAPASPSNSSSNKTEEKDPVVTTNSYKISYAGLIFKIPTNMIYSKEANHVSVYDDKDTWGVNFAASEGNISTLTIDQFKDWLISNGIAVEKTATEFYSNKRYFLANHTSNGYKVTAGMVQLTATHYAYFEGINASNTYLTSELKEISKIFEGVELDDNSFSAKPNEFLKPKTPFHEAK
jgi:hypothetical protein